MSYFPHLHLLFHFLSFLWVSVTALEVKDLFRRQMLLDTVCVIEGAENRRWLRRPLQLLAAEWHRQLNENSISFTLLFSKRRDCNDRHVPK